MQWNETHTDNIPPTTETQAKLIGTWQVTVTFYEGPLRFFSSHLESLLLALDVAICCPDRPSSAVGGRVVRYRGGSE